MFDSVIRSVVAEEYHTVFIIVQTDLGHLFALKHGSGSTSPDVVTSLEIYVLANCFLNDCRLHINYLMCGTGCYRCYENDSVLLSSIILIACSLV